MKKKIEVYRREDGKWAWRAIAPNGNIIATDGGQGYENKQDCLDMVAVVLAPTERPHQFSLSVDGTAIF